ncbi:MAG: DUF1580 domain-containing protein [Pseudomonadota bacterium]
MTSSAHNDPLGDASAFWWRGEDEVELIDAARLFPPRPGGSPPSAATIRRWARVGVHGIKLRTFANGARGRATTRQELERFIAALTFVRGLG